MRYKRKRNPSSCQCASNPRYSPAKQSVTPRQAQAAAEKLGWSRAEQIVGGSLSGASMAALVRLVREAERVRRNPRRRNPDLISWSGLNGTASGGWRYRIEDKSRPGDPWFTLYLIPPANSWAGGVMEPLVSRSSIDAVQEYAERTASEIAQRANPRRSRR